MSDPLTDRKMGAGTRSRRASAPPAGAPSRPPIPASEELKLWVRSGGRCALCNKYLLEDEAYVYDVRTGEMAHIVGWKDSAKSPRGKDSLPAAERNNADNLMLLCANDHQLIDKKKVEGDFTVQRLRHEKREHEERIYHLTGLARDRASAVLRVIGGVRGAAVEISREHARDAVYREEGRYASFPFSYDRQGIEVDLSSLPDPEKTWEPYWSAGREMVDHAVARVLDGVRLGDVRHLSVFGFARIPLLVHLGYRLGDKIPTTVYQKQRGVGETWGWPEAGQPLRFESAHIRASDQPGNVALLLSLSGTISCGELPDEVASGFNIFEIRPASELPNRDLLRSRASLDAFAECFHRFLAGLETTNKQAREVHLFPAAPLSAAIACGRGIMRDSQPALRVYDRFGGGYRYALTVNG